MLYITQRYPKVVINNRHIYTRYEFVRCTVLTIKFGQWV